MGTKRIKNGVTYMEPDVFKDFRGELWTLWKNDVFKPNLFFNHDKISTSRKNVLRGIHGDHKSHKLVTCLSGEIYFVTVDNRPDSSTYLQWDWVILDDKKRTQVLLEPGIGNGFFVLSDECVFHYKWSYQGAYPDVDEQFTIKWDDPRVGIDWPTDRPILQFRDR